VDRQERDVDGLGQAADRGPGLEGIGREFGRAAGRQPALGRRRGEEAGAVLGNRFRP